LLRRMRIAVRPRKFSVRLELDSVLQHPAAGGRLHTGLVRREFKQLTKVASHDAPETAERA